MIDIPLSFNNERDNNQIISELALFIQEIELGVKMSTGDVWNMYDSIDVSRYLFNRYVSISQIQNDIQNYIATHCHHGELFVYEVGVDFIQLDENNPNSQALYIEVAISDPDGSDDDTVVQQFLVGI